MDATNNPFKVSPKSWDLGRHHGSGSGHNHHHRVQIKTHCRIAQVMSDLGRGARPVPWITYNSGGDKVCTLKHLLNKDRRVSGVVRILGVTPDDGDTILFRIRQIGEKGIRHFHSSSTPMVGNMPRHLSGSPLLQPWMGRMSMGILPYWRRQPNSVRSHVETGADPLSRRPMT
jgi:hypothetical protein